MSCQKWFKMKTHGSLDILKSHKRPASEDATVALVCRSIERTIAINNLLNWQIGQRISFEKIESLQVLDLRKFQKLFITILLSTILGFEN